MARARLAAFAVAGVMSVASTGAAAQLCGGGSAGGGFDDVLAANNFCTSALWMKNRSITLGCGSGANYCPGDAVTRASMALFMNRLGNVLTPVLVSRQSGMGTGTNIPAGNYVGFCETDVIPAANHARRFRARGTISAVLSGSAIGMALYSRSNGGIVDPRQSQELRVATPSGDQVLHWSSDTFDIPAGTTVTVLIALINRGAGTLTLATNGRCAIEVESWNF